MRNRLRGTCAAVIILMLASVLSACSDDTIADVRIVQVQKADVRKTITIMGTVRYTDESFAFAHKDGKVIQVCKKEGDRVAVDDAIARIGSDDNLALLSTYATYTEGLPDVPGFTSVFGGQDAIRAKSDQTIRQILVEEGDLITCGTVVARLTSNRQEIVCTAAPVDAEKLKAGMWAWLGVEGESIGVAHIDRVANHAKTENGQSVSVIYLLPDKHISCAEGQTVEVEVYISGSDDVNSIPVEAVTPRGTVWWITDEGRCVEIDARMVMDNGFLAWVELPDGLPVAIGDFEEGQRVRVKQQ